MPDAIKDVIKKVTEESSLPTLESNFQKDFKKAELKTADIKAITSDLKSIGTKTCSELHDILGSLHTKLNQVIEEKETIKLREILRTTGAIVAKDEPKATVIKNLTSAFNTICLPLLKKLSFTVKTINCGYYKNHTIDLSSGIKDIKEQLKNLLSTKNDREFLNACTTLLTLIHTFIGDLETNIRTIQDHRKIQLKPTIPKQKPVSWDEYTVITASTVSITKELGDISQKLIQAPLKDLLAKHDRINEALKEIKKNPNFSPEDEKKYNCTKLQIRAFETDPSPEEYKKLYTKLAFSELIFCNSDDLFITKNQFKEKYKITNKYYSQLMQKFDGIKLKLPKNQ